jgi:hypothetical protein
MAKSNDMRGAVCAATCPESRGHLHHVGMFAHTRCADCRAVFPLIENTTAERARMVRP